MARSKIPIFNNKLAGYLMYKGFVLQGLSKGNKEDIKNMNVYFFNKSDELLKTIEEINIK